MISFLEPLALLGLAAALIPTLLHLLGRRLPPEVVFPAVRYLTATEREHSRRLWLRNLFLLILRTLVIVLVVLAAARPVARVVGGSSHPPTAVAIILDNSLSSRAVVEGDRTLSYLRSAARTVLTKLDAGDRLWLLLADGVPNRLTRIEARAALDSLEPSPLRLDLAAAVRAAESAVREDPLPWTEIVLLSDLQASALSPGEPVDARVLALAPPHPPLNRWIDSTWLQPRIWSPVGTVVAFLGAGSGVGDATTVRLAAAGRDVSRAVASPGEQVVLSGRMPTSGWTVGVVELDPDEFRADDRRFLAVRVAEPARARATPGAGRFVIDALQVLREGGRVARGDDVVLSDQLGNNVTVLFPPSDPALVGGLNRSLAQLGVGWRFGALVEGEWAIGDEIAATGEATVFRRHRLVGDGGAIAEVGDDPWLVREDEIVLLGSRLEADWTDLPVSAVFVPFIDFVVNQIAARESWTLSATPAEVVELPPGVTGLLFGGEIMPVSTRRITAPLLPGVYFMRGAGGDTVGALELNYDVRESQLGTADDVLLRSRLAEDVRVLSPTDLANELFAAVRRAALTGWLLALALACLVIEFAVASSRTMTKSRG